jgi:NAD(P)-dependent dehydrogenase (short-subunit alcohol dehydrogenase family)
MPMEKTNQIDALSNVVITGARGALGSTLTETFLGAGCRVAGVDIAVETEGEILADDSTDGLFWRHVDATDPSSVQTAVEDIDSELGSIDALINCAGGYRWSHIDDVSDDDLDFLVGANLRSGLLFVREVVPKMTDQGFGRIVLMSSKSTLNPGEGEGPYASSKAGLNTLAESVAAEVKEEDVNINAVLPSIIDTPANRDSMPDADYSKWVKRDQLADIIFRLTQPFGDPINGALIPVAGRM